LLDVDHLGVRLRRALLERSVGAMPVIVPGVFGEDRQQVTCVKDQHAVHSRRMVPTQRSAIAFARGARGGILMILMPIEVNTSSKPTVNLGGRGRG
jgi:hypothetical protein